MISTSWAVHSPKSLSCHSRGDGGQFFGFRPLDAFDAAQSNVTGKSAFGLFGGEVADSRFNCALEAGQILLLVLDADPNDSGKALVGEEANSSRLAIEGPQSSGKRRSTASCSCWTRSASTLPRNLSVRWNWARVVQRTGPSGSGAAQLGLGLFDGALDLLRHGQGDEESKCAGAVGFTAAVRRGRRAGGGTIPRGSIRVRALWRLRGCARDWSSR